MLALTIFNVIVGLLSLAFIVQIYDRLENKENTDGHKDR